MAQPQRKRHRGKHTFSAEQLLAKLRDVKLVGALLQDSVWILADADQADNLDVCCFGTYEGGAETVPSIAAIYQNTCQGVHAVRLTLVEACFAMSHLNCLRVHQWPSPSADEGAQPLAQGGADPAAEAGPPAPPELTLQELWGVGVALTGARFVHSYVAYRHFRCKGWIPRSGVLYGTDMVLYRNHPAAVHSEYCVVLLPLSGQKLQLRTWSDLQVCLRLVNQVNKALLLLHIKLMDGAADGTVEWKDPACVHQFQVCEQLISRWDPDSTR